MLQNTRSKNGGGMVADAEYKKLGRGAVKRVTVLLKKLDSVRASQERGSEVKAKALTLFHKFMEQVESIFAALPRPKEWRSYYVNDLPLLSLPSDVSRMATANTLNPTQTRALAKLKIEGG